MQPATISSILSWIIVGSIAGYVASLLLRAERQGCLINVAIGIAGAFVGSFVMRNFFPGIANFFGTGPVAGFFNGIVHAIVGAIIVLVILELILPGQQLGMRGSGGRRRTGRRRR